MGRKLLKTVVPKRIQQKFRELLGKAQTTSDHESTAKTETSTSLKDSIMALMCWKHKVRCGELKGFPP